MTKWYAVQKDRSDAWDNGSHDYYEAVKMLREQGSGLIAVIDEEDGFCLEEIAFEDLPDIDAVTIRHLGNEIQLTEDGDYRPDHLIINGELASMSAYAEAHDGKNWRAAAGGNVLMYRAASGKEYEIPQKRLQSRFQDHLREAIQASGLSQRAFAEVLGVPLRTLEDWRAGRRVPAGYVQESVLAKAAEL